MRAPPCAASHRDEVGFVSILFGSVQKRKVADAQVWQSMSRRCGNRLLCTRRHCRCARRRRRKAGDRSSGARGPHPGRGRRNPRFAVQGSGACRESICRSVRRVHRWCDRPEHSAPGRAALRLDCAQAGPVFGSGASASGGTDEVGHDFPGRRLLRSRGKGLLRVDAGSARSGDGYVLLTRALPRLPGSVLRSRDVHVRRAARPFSERRSAARAPSGRGG